MPRARRHFIPGYIWHITHRCHKKEFLLRFAKDRQRWMIIYSGEELKKSHRGSHPEATQNAPKSCKGVSKMKEDDFNTLVKSIKQAGNIKDGQLKPGRTFEFNPMDIKAIRNKLRKSQSEFALMIGVSVSTLQNWEQGRRKPDGPARALLKVASENPEAVSRALEA